MKSRIFILATMTLATVMSCSIDQVTAVNEDNVISFRIAVPNATRGTATTASSLEGFSVWGFTSDGLVMEHTTATRTGNTYVTNPSYFWPTLPVDFYALSPVISVSADDVFLTTADGSGIIGTVSIGTAERTLDITEIPYEAESQIDLIYAAHPQATSGSSVSLNFRHSLSQIVFHAKNTNPDMQVRVAGVRIACVYGANTYTLPSDTDGNLTDVGSTEGAAGYQGIWGGSPSHKAFFKAGVTSSSDTYINVSGDGEPVNLTGEDGALFMLPQQVPAWNQNGGDHYNTEMGAYFLINCKIINGGVELWPATDGIDYAEVAVPVEVAWEEGYKYTYTFIFGDGAGYYPPTGEGISDYPTDPEYNSSAPADPKDDAEPTPILSPIQFSVDIDEIQSFDDMDVEVGGTEEVVEPEEPDEPDESDDVTQYMVDEVFIRWCLSKNDKDGNGYLSHAEAAEIYNVEDCEATDFTGIEYLVNLQSFICYTVEKVDLSQNVNLTNIRFGNSGKYGAPIVTLDLSNNTSLTRLNMYAFAYCGNLTTITLPESVTQMGSYVFDYCTSLKSVNIPDGVTDIPANTFSYCSSLKSITLPSNLKSIGTFAFGYTGLTSVTIPASVDFLDYAAFCYSDSLRQVTVLAETPPELGLYVFYGISKSATLYVPSGCGEAYEESDWAEYFANIQEQ